MADAAKKASLWLLVSESPRLAMLTITFCDKLAGEASRDNNSMPMWLVILKTLLLSQCQKWGELVGGVAWLEEAQAGDVLGKRLAGGADG